MRRLILVLALSAMPLTAAKAHDHDWPLDTDIGIEQALETAYENGLVLVRSIEFDDGVWEIEGRNDAGARLEIDIDGATGQIVTPR